jgi:DNA-binding transcriptional ArsR family regulator
MANYLDSMDATFSSLADRSRRKIVSRLMLTPGASVSDLTRDIPLKPQTITKHLDVLADAGLIRRVKKGRFRRIYPVKGSLNPALAWLEKQQGFWSRSLDTLATVVEERDG